jgi:S-adenosylmethionine-dependent methyltransferase
MNIVEQSYDGMAEGEWGRLERHRVEYGVTMKALEEFLPAAPARVADIGGGTGRYSIELARRGYEVTLVDLSSKCLEFARGKAAEAGVQLAAVIHADARDPSMLEDGAFDAALLMGPLYHLLEHGERVRAVQEARRVLRPGGKVFAAAITRNIIVQSAAAIDVEYIVRCRQQLEAVLTTGIFRKQPENQFPDAWLCLPDEVPPLMCEGGFEQIVLMNTEALVCQLEAKINAAPDELHRQWIDLVYRLGRDPAVLGTGGHLLYVGRKGG